MPVDDKLATRWAAEALVPGAGKSYQLAQAEIAKDLLPDPTKAAWEKLKGCRDAGNRDVNLVAAEHYLFIRFLANKDGDTAYRKLPGWYQAVKQFAFKTQLEDYLKTTDQPVSPVDPDVLAWGNRGVERGLQEYTKRTGKPPSTGISALLTVFGTTYFTYYYAGVAGDYTVTPGCSVKAPA